MVRISSLLTAWYKRQGRIVLFAGMAGLLGLLAWLAFNGRIAAVWLAVPPVLAAAAFLYLRRFTAGLADDVQDAGDALLVHHGGNSWRIPLGSITQVGYTCIADPPRITVVHRDAAGATETFEFMPKLDPCMALLRPPPVLGELRRRAEAARGAAAR